MLDLTRSAPTEPESGAAPGVREAARVAKALHREIAFRTQLAPAEDLARVTVTLPKSLTRKVNGYRDAFRMSVSSIVEHAVRAYLEDGRDDDLLQDLRARGASRRRTKRKPARGAV
ncbi:MAG: hypothetical protein M3Z07_04170 [Candidatus Eremiobacteraeota bacterium]|nr:hypothetical protein [Candidatus Eremiobacteraeota bacterium]